jgi:4-aminobutyrate aminotransferase-like enzyme
VAVPRIWSPSVAPEGFSKVFFTNAGADANENAIRAARQFTGRDKIISSYRSYHGNTGAAISATGDWRRKPNDFSRGHVHIMTPYSVSLTILRATRRGGMRSRTGTF